MHKGQGARLVPINARCGERRGFQESLSLSHRSLRRGAQLQAPGRGAANRFAVGINQCAFHSPPWVEQNVEDERSIRWSAVEASIAGRDQRETVERIALLSGVMAVLFILRIEAGIAVEAIPPAGVCNDQARPRIEATNSMKPSWSGSWK